MKIIASNGRIYDLENLSDAERNELTTLGHLAKTTQGVVVVVDSGQNTPSGPEAKSNKK